MSVTSRIVQFVIKTSKHCNLRCKYCYEYAELGNKQVIKIEQLKVMYENILNYYQKVTSPVHIEFVWHGGEPLLQHPDFYWQVLDMQNDIFREFLGKITNVVQTNLTLLDSDRLHLLKYGFDAVGVSLDLFGDLRVDQRGVNSQSKVLSNIDKLSLADVDIGCITVLTRKNLEHVEEIYKFYRQMKMSVRILPLFHGAFEDQHQGFEIDAYDVLAAYKKLVDLWLEDDELVSIVPIVESILQVRNYYTPDAPTIFYDKREWESIYIVDLDGSMYSYSDAYDVSCSHGNIFNTSLEDIIHSPAHEKILQAAEERMLAVCSECKFFGSCSGYPMAEGVKDYNNIHVLDSNRCVVDRGILEYIEYRLIEGGIINPETGFVDTRKLDLSGVSSLSLGYV